MKISTFVLIAAMLTTACTFNPVDYDELRKQEHVDHLKQNGV